MAGATHWLANGAEGLLLDDAVERRPSPGDHRVARYWHPVGRRLWESRCWPLAEAAPAVGAWDEADRAALLVTNLPTAPEPLRNVSVAMDSRDTSPGPATPVIRLDLAPGAPATELGFRIRLARGDPRQILDRLGPAAPDPGGPSLRVDGPAYVVENDHYRAVIQRSAGGHLRRLDDKRHGTAVLSEAWTYTHSHVKPELGMAPRWDGICSSRQDPEPDVWVWRDGPTLRLRFRSFLRTSLREYRDVGVDPTAYSLEYAFDDSATFTTRCGTRRSTAGVDAESFLSHNFTVLHATHWFANAAERQVARPVTGPADRFWETTKAPWLPGPEVFGLQSSETGWRVEFEITEDPAERGPADVFLHRSPPHVSVFLQFHRRPEGSPQPPWEWMTWRTRLCEAHARPL